MSRIPEFKTPKATRHGDHMSSPRRPQPSPLKRELLLRDLGLDEDDTLADISTPSDTDSESDETQPSEIEFRILQKELQSITQEKEVLQKKNFDLQRSLQQVKTRLKREETSKKTRTKILQKANLEALKDKHNLILDLQDLIQEGGDHASLKLISSIEKLQDEKAELKLKLITIQGEYEDKIHDIEDQMQQGNLNERHGTFISEDIQNKELAQQLQTCERQLIEASVKHESAVKTKDEELSKIKMENEEMRISIEELRRKADDLSEELRSCKQAHVSKEKESSYMVKKQKEEMKLLVQEKERLQSVKDAIEGEMLSRLSDQESSANQMVVKLKEENQRYSSQMERLQREIVSLGDKTARLEDAESECEKMSNRNNELLDTIKILENSLEKQKVSAKERLHAAESELEETRTAMQLQRKNAQENYEDLKTAMSTSEEQLKKDLADAEKGYKEQKEESDKFIKRLEEKLSKSSDKVKQLKTESSELTSKLALKTNEVESMREKHDAQGLHLINTEQSVEEARTKLRTTENKVQELMNALDESKVVQENYKRQLDLLSGKSTSAIAEKEKEAGDLRMRVSSAEHQLQDEKRKSLQAAEEISRLQKQLDESEQKIASERLNHQSSLQNFEEEHKHELLKLKASTAIATQTLQTKATAFQKLLRFVATALPQLAHENAALKREVEKFPEVLKQSLKQAGKMISEAVSEINENCKDLVRKYKKEMKLRKKYHNELVELRGNIRVFVRARPRINEDGPVTKMVLSYDENDDGLINVNNAQRGRNQSYEVDRVFRPDSTQDEVYKEVQALVTSCMDGYQVCIFAYGQTGSGKTFTMEGTPASPGINQRALKDLFDLVDERAEDWTYSVSVSLVEIYNETLKDLLSSAQQKLDIKMNPDGSLFVQGLTNKQVRDLEDVNKIFGMGRRNRATASTNMNERSSRSHAVLVVNVHGVNKTTSTEVIGKLNLIDLAGSERVSKSGASGDRLKEAQNINKSLSSLGDVIHALRNKQSHVPFRNSKLTYLLQDSLSKDSKTLMVVQVAPVEKNVSETLCSLAFAQRVRAVELGQATKKTK